MEQTLTLEKLPAAFMDLDLKIERILMAVEKSEQEPDRKLTIEQLCEYLPGKPAKATIYGLVSNRQIPYEKFGKRLYFRKSEIDQWVNNGRQMTL